MTLIAVLSADRHPVALVDGLVTTPHGFPAPVDTPLVAGDSRAGVDGMRPAGVASKAIRLGDGTHILCAGNMLHGWRVMTWARALLKVTGHYDLPAHQRLTDMALRSAALASFIVIQAVDETLAMFTHGHIEAVESETFGTVLVGGFGTAPFLESLRSMPAVVSDGIARGDDDIHGVAAANALLLQLRVSQEYLAKESRLAAASTGGFFETLFPPVLFGSKIPPHHHRWAEAGTALFFVDVTTAAWTLERVVIFSRAGSRCLVMSTTCPVPMSGESTWRIPRDVVQALELGTSVRETQVAKLPIGHRIPLQMVAVSARAHCPTCPCQWIARGAEPRYGGVLGFATMDVMGLWLTPTHLQAAVHSQIERVYNCACPRCGAGLKGD